MLRRMLAMSVLFLLPSVCFAAVEINEIAWMGTAAGSANEWIELHNTGTTDIDLSGWKVVSVPAKIAIPLKGAIAPDGYYLIERSNDNVIPEIPADLIASFSTGLSNDGMTLDLLDASGAVVDDVVGGVSWKNIGGSLSTKETAQRTPTGWITAPGTPGAPNASATQVGDTNGDTSTPTLETSASNTPNTVQDITVDTHTSSGSSPTNKTAVVRRDAYRIVVHSNERIYKDIPTTLSAQVTGLSDEALPNATVVWNLGDGTVATGTSIAHTYRFPGTYPVIVNAAYAGLSAQVRAKAVVLAQEVHIVNALPGSDGYVSIVSPVDIDLSGWSLRDGGVSFTFPPQTQLFGKVPVTFANAVTGMYVQQTLALFRSDGRLMSAVGEGDEAAPTEAYIPNQLSLARSATQPPVLVPPATSTATSLGSWSFATAGGLRFPTWGYWVLAAFFVGAAGLIIVLSKGFTPDREVAEEAEKYTFIELDSNLEDIT